MRLRLSGRNCSRKGRFCRRMVHVKAEPEPFRGILYFGALMKIFQSSPNPLPPEVTMLRHL